MLISIRAYVSAKIRKIVKSEEGVSIVEYSLLLALITLACVAGMTALGTSFNSFFQDVSGLVDGTPPSGGS
jgi:pilus assembly protein Flp/PilA